MPISYQNLKLMKPERTTGGRMSGVEVIDGDLNNLFPNLSTVDFTAGGLEIAKCYGWVNSADTSVFRGTFFCLTRPPSNPAVTCVIFTTRDWFDYITEHREFLSNYLAIGPRMLAWIPTQGGINAGSMMIQLWGSLGAKVPEMGETYVLMENEGKSTERSMSIKIASVAYEDQQFDDNIGVYYKRIVTLTLESELSDTYEGSTISRYTPVNPPSTLHTTFPAGATRVYGVMTLAEAIAADTSTFRVESIYAQVVPASVSDILLVNQDASGRAVALIPAAGGNIEFAYNVDFGPGLPMYLGQPAEKGSVSIIAGAATLTESKGSLWSGATEVARVDSEHGLVVPVDGAPLFTGAKTVRYKPAAAQAQPLYSASILVTQGNQSRVWSYHFPVRPAKGSIRVAYLAGGAWYELVDNGDAIVGSQAAFGAAGIDSLNTLSMTFGTAPDVGSRIMIFWGVDSYTFDRSASTVGKASFEIVTAAAIAPTTLTLSWHDGIATRSASDDGNGNLTGAATGKVYYALKKIVMRPNTIPPKGTVVTVNITPYAQAQETFDAMVVVSGGTASLTLGHGDVLPKSVRLGFAGVKTNTPPVYTPVPPPPDPASGQPVPPDDGVHTISGPNA